MRVCDKGGATKLLAEIQIPIARKHAHYFHRNIWYETKSIKYPTLTDNEIERVVSRWPCEPNGSKVFPPEIYVQIKAYEKRRGHWPLKEKTNEHFQP